MTRGRRGWLGLQRTELPSATTCRSSRRTENVDTLAMRGDSLCQIVAEEVEPRCDMPIVRSFEFARRARPNGPCSHRIGSPSVAVTRSAKSSERRLNFRDSEQFPSRGLTMKSVGKPDAGNRHVRFAQPQVPDFDKELWGATARLTSASGRFKITDRTFIASRPDTPSIIPATLFSAQSVSIRMTNSRICLLAASSPTISPSRSRLPWSKTGSPSGWRRSLLTYRACGVRISPHWNQTLHWWARSSRRDQEPRRGRHHRTLSIE